MVKSKLVESNPLFGLYSWCCERYKNENFNIWALHIIWYKIHTLKQWIGNDKSIKNVSFYRCDLNFTPWIWDNCFWGEENCFVTVHDNQCQTKYHTFVEFKDYQVEKAKKKWISRCWKILSSTNGKYVAF